MTAKSVAVKITGLSQTEIERIIEKYLKEIGFVGFSLSEAGGERYIIFESNAT